jgi:hypothetical protein
LKSAPKGKTKSTRFRHVLDITPWRNTSCGVEAVLCSDLGLS